MPRRRSTRNTETSSSRSTTGRGGGRSTRVAARSPASSPEPKRRKPESEDEQSQELAADSRSHTKVKMGEGEGRTKVLSDAKFKALNKALKIDKKKPQASQLKAKQVDFHKEENRLAHRTDNYELQQLIVRRGQTFNVTVTFNREYKPSEDVVMLQFVTGKRPQQSKGSIVRVPVRDTLIPSQWGMKVIETSGKTLQLSVMSSAKAIIGEYEVFVETKHKESSGKSPVVRYKDDDKVCILFNAWCKDDAVYMEKESERDEYVMADFGYIWVGSASYNHGIPWTFGQFEDVSLECALWLLDKGELTAKSRSSPVHVVRTISAMANYNDSDGGILFGRWTETYPKNCTQPTAWTGSVSILEKFWRKKFMVRYGQCWVFSGLVTTLLRALGLPTRSVTNFASAHDTDGSLTIDFHFDGEGNPLDDFDDSIWNFHVWNESWFKRPDLPDGHDGWQAHDATPQETSEGVFRCGPASLKAIKNGEVYLPYDTGFVFAEVNGDRVYWDVDEDGSMRAGHVDKYSIGRNISTKAVGSRDRNDVTSEYKYPEGSKEERKAVEFAYKFSTRSEYDIYNFDGDAVCFKVDVVDSATIGDNFDVHVVAENTSSKTKSVMVNVTAVIAFYTGIPAKKLKGTKETIVLKPKEEKTVTLKIASADYIGKMAADANIKLYVKGTVEDTGQSYATQDVVELVKPKLTITTSPKNVKMNDEFEVTVSFKNPLSVPLKNGLFNLEIAGVKPRSMEIKCDGPVGAKKEAKASATFTAARKGKRNVVASFQSDQLTGVRGECTVEVQ